MPGPAPGLALTVRVPGSSANLGPGFDAVGLALGVYDEYEVEVLPRPGLVVRLEGEGRRRLPANEKHLVAAQLRAGLEARGIGWLDGYGLRLTCRNTLPMAAGMGSSAAGIVAGRALAAGLTAPDALTPPDGLGASELDRINGEAAAVEGHPDNTSASVHGGLTLSWADREGGTCTVRPSLHPEVTAVVLRPVAESVSTAAARAALGPSVPRADAVEQATRSALLLHALTADPGLLWEATADRLHQEARRSVYPVSMAAVDVLREAGHAGAVSGAGPTVLCLTTADRVSEVLALAEQWPAEWDVRAPGIDTQGLEVTIRER